MEVPPYAAPRPGDRGNRVELLGTAGLLDGWSSDGAAADQCGLVGRAMGGRHESPGRGTDMFMALVVLALLAILAAVVIPALTGG
jgi:hypothetical protein